MLTSKYFFDFEVNKLETHNVKYNHQIGLSLGDITGNKNINPNTLLQFYVLNDFNYLNYKSNNNINLDFMVSLVQSKEAFSEFFGIMKLETTISKDKDYIEINKQYSQFINHYECIFIKLNKLTLDLYNSRLDKNEAFISPTEIRKTRMITYFQYLFNQFN